MKRIYYLLFATLLFFSACMKQLDIEPQNSITFKNGIKTEKDIESLFNAIDILVRSNLSNTTHKTINGFKHYFNSPGFWGSLEVDLDRLIRADQFSWNVNYRIIHSANIPLEYLDQTDLSEERKNYYRGKANFYKAYAYWGLIRVLGDVILIKDDVILSPVAKTPWPEVADYAIGLAENAVTLLPEYSAIKDAQGNPPINKFSPSKGTANALLAELAAWKAGAKYLAQPANAKYDERALWEKAEIACTKIIESGEYSLAANPEEVCEKVLVGDSRESIYELDYRRFWDEIANGTGNDGMATYLPYQPQLFPNPTFSNYGDADFLISADTVMKIFSANDLRRNSFFYKLDSLYKVPDLKGYAVPNKYRKLNFFTSGPRIGEVNGVFQNHIIWRLAGIYLLRAECRARLGETAGAIADLNLVKARSQGAPYVTSEGDLRYTIYVERAKKELIFEPGIYWFDMIRNGYTRSELKDFGYDKLSDQDLIDGALFDNIEANNFENNPLLRQNTYWWKRFGQ